MIQVSVLKVGADQRTVELSPGATVEAALSQAGYGDTTGLSLSRNGRPTTLGAEVSNGDLITLTQKVVGGR